MKLQKQQPKKAINKLTIKKVKQLILSKVEEMLHFITKFIYTYTDINDHCLFKKLLFTMENATAAGSSQSNISRIYI